MERKKAELVLTNIGELVTISGFSERPAVNVTIESLGSIHDKDLVIASSEGRICFIGKHSELSAHVDTSSAVEINCEGHLVTPGFVDSHTHAMFAGSRENELEEKLNGVSYLEILKRGGGILKTVRDTRHASKETLETETKDRLDRMMNAGTTTFEIKTGYGLNVADEVKMLEAIHNLKKSHAFDIEATLLSAHAIPPEYKGRAESYIREIVEPTIRIASERKLARFCDVFLEEGVFDIHQAKEILEIARANGMVPKVHADEFSDLGGAHLAAEMKTITADHLLKAPNQGLHGLAQAGVISVLLPGTSFSSFVGSYANAREIIKKKGAVALGTDLSPNSWIESMQFVISLACFGMKMTPSEAIVASTINSAHAIGRAHDVGSIEEGKFCDLLIWNLKNYLEIPYRIGSNSISKVVKRGNLVRNSWN